MSYKLSQAEKDIIIAANALVCAHIDEQLKDDVAAVLAEMGLTVSDVVRMTLIRIAGDKALPFELKVPNAETQATMVQSRTMMKADRARFTEAQGLFDALDQEAGQR